MTGAEIIRLHITASSKAGALETFGSALKNALCKRVAHQRKKESSMIKIGLVLVCAVIVAMIVLWPKPPAATAPVTAPMAQTISIQGLHSLATLDRLPVQQFEDQSLVFPGSAEQTR